MTMDDNKLCNCSFNCSCFYQCHVDKNHNLNINININYVNENEINENVENIDIDDGDDIEIITDYNSFIERINNLETEIQELERENEYYRRRIAESLLYILMNHK